MTRLSPDKRMLEYALNDACPDIFAFSTTRHGGTSTGNYASLNCTPYTGDAAENVSRNQELLLQALPQRPPHHPPAGHLPQHIYGRLHSCSAIRQAQPCDSRRACRMAGNSKPHCHQDVGTHARPLRHHGTGRLGRHRTRHIAGSLRSRTRSVRRLPYRRLPHGLHLGVAQ